MSRIWQNTGTLVGHVLSLYTYRSVSVDVYFCKLHPFFLPFFYNLKKTINNHKQQKRHTKNKKISAHFSSLSFLPPPPQCPSSSSKTLKKDVTDFFTSPHGFSLLTRTPGADRSPYLNHAITPDPHNNTNSTGSGGSKHKVKMGVCDEQNMAEYWNISGHVLSLYTYRSVSVDVYFCKLHPFFSSLFLQLKKTINNHKQQKRHTKKQENLCTFFFSLFSPTTPSMPLLFFKDFEKDVTDFFTSPHGFLPPHPYPRCRPLPLP